MKKNYLFCLYNKKNHKKIKKKFYIEKTVFELLQRSSRFHFFSNKPPINVPQTFIFVHADYLRKKKSLKIIIINKNK
jgi:hypothetical protein